MTDPKNHQPPHSDAEQLYLDALRMRDWSIGVSTENGSLRWKLEKVTGDFNSAVLDVEHHRNRADSLEKSVARRIGRAITMIPRGIRSLARSVR
jgi:hypothetical protein